MLLLGRRAFQLLGAAALWTPLPTPAAPAPFELVLPPSFVRLNNLGSTSRDAGILLVAGDFRTTIASGGATTVSVQSLSPSTLPPLPPSTPEEASRLAAALASLRDQQALVLRLLEEALRRYQYRNSNHRLKNSQ